MPRRPWTMPIRISGTIRARKGVWRPTIAAEVALVEARGLGQRGDRDGDRAERDRSRVGHEGERRGLDGPEAERDQHHGADGHWSPEAGERLHQRAEAEGDDHGLDALVVRDGAESA